MSGADRGHEGAAALMAVLFVDLAGYTRLVGERETETLAFMDDCLARFTDTFRRHDGDLVKKTGDGAVAVFPTSTDAVACALEIQRSLAGEPDYRFRIGVHVGEVRRHGGDAYGHAVNVAARLEQLAEPGSILVSHEIVASARRTGSFAFEAIGERQLHNIADPVLIYRARDAAADGAADNGRPAGLEVAVLGGLRLVARGRDLPLPARSPRVLALLAVLVLSAERSESVDRLTALLVPEREGEAARRAVLDAARRLRTLLGPALETARGRIRLDPRGLRLDLDRLFADIRRGRVDPVLLAEADWTERILDGIEPTGPAFESWLAVTRTERRERAASLLEAELGRAEGPQDVGLRDVAAALLRVEPGHERAARALIRHHHATGNPAAARRVFDRLEAVLHGRYGIAPQPETEVAARAPGTPVARPARLAAEPIRIQLRPFAGRGPDETALLDTFRGELMAGLACFRGWSVVEGAQSPRAALTDYALAAGPGAEGTHSLALVEAATGRLVWSQDFDLGRSSLRDARREAIGRIAATLEVYVTSDRAGLATARDGHATVDAWLAGERLIPRWTPEAHDEAAAIFAGLIDRAPGFAPAYASLASLGNVGHIVRPGAGRSPEVARRSLALADRAAELDPLDARNQLAVAWSAALDGRFDKAALHMDMAARLNPHSPRTLVSAAMGFAFFGEPARARALLDHSLASAPALLDYQWCYAAAVRFLAREDEAAVEAARRSGDRIVDNPGWLAAALARLGRRDEAAAAFATLVQDVSAAWCGPGPATPEAVADWFVTAYPLRHPEDRETLAHGLRMARAGG